MARQRRRPDADPAQKTPEQLEEERKQRQEKWEDNWKPRENFYDRLGIIDRANPGDIQSVIDAALRNNARARVSNKTRSGRENLLRDAEEALLENKDEYDAFIALMENPDERKRYYLEKINAVSGDSGQSGFDEVRKILEKLSNQCLAGEPEPTLQGSREYNIAELTAIIYALKNRLTGATNDDQHFGGELIDEFKYANLLAQNELTVIAEKLEELFISELSRIGTKKDREQQNLQERLNQEAADQEHQEEALTKLSLIHKSRGIQGFDDIVSILQSFLDRNIQIIGGGDVNSEIAYIKNLKQQWYDNDAIKNSNETSSVLVNNFRDAIQVQTHPEFLAKLGALYEHEVEKTGTRADEQLGGGNPDIRAVNLAKKRRAELREKLEGIDPADVLQRSKIEDRIQWLDARIALRDAQEMTDQPEVERLEGVLRGFDHNNDYRREEQLRMEQSTRVRLEKNLARAQEALKNLTTEKKTIDESIRELKEQRKQAEHNGDAAKIIDTDQRLEQKNNELGAKERDIKALNDRIKETQRALDSLRDKKLVDLELGREESNTPEEYIVLDNLVADHHRELNRESRDKFIRGGVKVRNSALFGLSVLNQLTKFTEATWTATKKSVSAVWNGFLEFMDEHMEFRGKHTNLHGFWKNFSADVAKRWRSEGKGK